MSERRALANERRAIDISGVRCGALVALHKTERYSGSARLWECICDCGKTTLQKSWWIRNGKVKSCGCLTQKILSEARTIHGDTDSPTWLTWKSMIERCHKSAHKSFADYGGRGVLVCARWLASYENFKADMGERPSGNSIGRIDNSRGYEPGNCRWETPKEQARNRRSNRILEYRGERRCVAEWAEITEIPETAIAKRLKLGWSVPETLSRPARPDHRRRGRNPRAEGRGAGGQAGGAVSDGARKGVAVYAEYERLKAEWIARNPGATPAQYEAAMRRIARQLGV